MHPTDGAKDINAPALASALNKVGESPETFQEKKILIQQFINSSGGYTQTSGREKLIFSRGRHSNLKTLASEILRTVSTEQTNIFKRRKEITEHSRNQPP